MHVVTFYSFKGGAGRSLALVNIACELASRGRRVLMVDFDLEAPGLNTYAALNPRPNPGVVDYVCEYLRLGSAPDVSSYVYKMDTGAAGAGELWMMTAGREDNTYADSLSRINWGELYAENDGYLLFEELRAQWEERIRPDYVLIDSRTGHADVAGICVRQLPDAVVFVFFPNEQNLRGLSDIVPGARHSVSMEANRPRELLFVASNVPDLDDEDGIVQERIDAFRHALGFERLSATIHHYDSLVLMNQTIFVVARPRSRLAREYQGIALAIMECNLDDRDGVINYLRNLNRRSRLTRRSGDGEALENRLERLAAKHPRDGDVLFALASVREALGQLRQAYELSNQAVQAGNVSSSVFLMRARYHAISGEADAAKHDAYSAMRSPKVPVAEVRAAVNLMRFTLDDARDFVRLPAVMSLSLLERLSVTEELQRTKVELATARALLEPLVESQAISTEERLRVGAEFGIVLIGLGDFARAAEYYRGAGGSEAEKTIRWVFNCAMAEWGQFREPVQERFAHVIALHEQTIAPPIDANYWECIGLAAAVLGREEAATDALARAREFVLMRRGSVFSCWRYLRVASADFVGDLKEIASLAQGHKLVPKFMRDD